MKEARKALTPEVKAARPYEQRIIAWLDEQEANAEIEESEGKQWGHDDVTGFIENAIGGFMDGFSIAKDFGAGHDLEMDTNDAAKQTLELQKNEQTRDIKEDEEEEAEKIERANRVATGWFEGHLPKSPDAHAAEPMQLTHKLDDASFAQTVTSAELGAAA